MSDELRLQRLLQHIDGRSYPAYRDLKGQWMVGGVTLMVDHVQGDPFAAPSRLRGVVCSDLSPELHSDAEGKMATEDWLLRQFASRLPNARRGSGKSGLIDVYRPGPEVVRRSAVVVSADGQIEVRFAVGLPARGRRVLGREAEQLIFSDILTAFRGLADSVQASELREHVRSVRQQQALRRQLRQNDLVAFVGNGSILPRQTGISPKPLSGAIPFASPPQLEVTLDSPDGPVVGMGIRAGVSLIVGGGFHGKSTLLHAVQHGIWDHIPGDGRCLVVSDPDTVKVRAEDGRFVQGVDISCFLNNLPGAVDTRDFCTHDASGSTSQAAGIVEAIESGARLLLIDEDTSATNLLVRDERMRELIPPECEPITPFVQRVQQLWSQHGVSTLMVVGGVGDYLDVADLVIMMNHWRPADSTEQAKLLSRPGTQPVGDVKVSERALLRSSLSPRGKGRIRARDGRRLEFGLEEIDLTGVEQVIDSAQAVALGLAIRLGASVSQNQMVTMRSLLTGIEHILADEGLDALPQSKHPIGSLVWPRRHEIAAAISRLRSLQTVPSTGDS